MIPGYVASFNLRSLAFLESLMEPRNCRIILDIDSGYTQTIPVRIQRINIIDETGDYTFIR